MLRVDGLPEVLKQQKWPTLIALPILIVGLLLELYVLWGILFVYWGVTSMLSGEIYLVEPITRRDDPALFWIILGMWIGSGLLYIHTSLIPYI